MVTLPPAQRAEVIVLNAAAHAYRHPRDHDATPFDPEVCHQCQWADPEPNNTLCTKCKEPS